MRQFRCDIELSNTEFKARIIPNVDESVSSRRLGRKVDGCVNYVLLHIERVAGTCQLTKPN